MLDIIRRKWPQSLGIVPDHANQHHEKRFIELLYWAGRNTERNGIQVFQLSYNQEGYPISQIMTLDDDDVGMTGIKQLCKS
jgi:hypothetical protein